MIYKKDLQEQIDSLARTASKIEDKNIERYQSLIDHCNTIAEYLGCEFTLEKSVETPGYNGVGWDGKERFFITGKDYIKETIKLVKKTKKNR